MAVRTKFYCQCGCGQIIGKGKQFITHHNMGAGVNNLFFGRTHTEASKRKLAKAHMGKTLSQETKDKLSIAGKGRPCSEKCKQVLHSRIDENHPLWKGGIKRTGGRVYIKVGLKAYTARARIVAEQMLGRPLTSDEIAHHINGIKDDDRPENIEVVNRTTHTIHHHKGAVRSEETRRNIGKTSKGRKHSIETRSQISSTLLKRRTT